MHIIFFDPPTTRNSLKPFTLTRPIAEIRVGIWTIARKWLHFLMRQDTLPEAGYMTESYLQAKYPLLYGSDNLLLNGSLLPDKPLAEQVLQLAPGSFLQKGKQIIAVRLSENDLLKINEQLTQTSYDRLEHVLQHTLEAYTAVSYAAEYSSLQYNWDIFQQNAAQIAADFAWTTAGRSSAVIQDPHTVVYNPENVFVEEGVSVRAAVINAEEGPVYIGRNATIHENAVIKGPFAMLEGAHINIGSKIRDATTVGPYCKVGGEVKNTVFFANSNKGHEGFLGNAVVGEWCNFGADTNCSNLKNNYKPVRVWHYGPKDFVDTGLLFCGLLMGDHSKCGINTMFNTGTVVGVSCNIFGSGYSPKFIPSFTWGGIQEQQVYAVDKALEVVRNVLERRSISLQEEDKAILRYVYEHRQREKNSRD